MGLMEGININLRSSMELFNCLKRFNNKCTGSVKSRVECDTWWWSSFFISLLLALPIVVIQKSRAKVADCEMWFMVTQLNKCHCTTLLIYSQSKYNFFVNRVTSETRINTMCGLGIIMYCQRDQNKRLPNYECFVERRKKARVTISSPSLFKLLTYHYLSCGRIDPNCRLQLILRRIWSPWGTAGWGDSLSSVIAPVFLRLVSRSLLWRYVQPSVLLVLRGLSWKCQSTYSLAPHWNCTLVHPRSVNSVEKAKTFLRLSKDQCPLTGPRELKGHSTRRWLILVELGMPWW